MQDSVLGVLTASSYQVSSLSLIAEQTGLAIIAADIDVKNQKLVEQLQLQRRLKDIVSVFNSHEYAKATKLLVELLASSSNPRDAQFLTALRSISEGYAKWDEFDYRQAIPMVGGAMGALKTWQQAWREDISEGMQFKQIGNNLAFLAELVKGTKGMTKTSSLLALDLWKNGLRRYYKGNNSDAIIRFYRAVEAMVQARLRDEYGVDASRLIEPYPTKLTKEVREAFLRELGYEKFPPKLGANDGLVLLRVLSDPFAKEIPPETITGLQTSRNQCVLTHGLALPSDEALLGFSKNVEAILRIFFKSKGEEIDPVAGAAEHISLDDSELTRITFG